MDRARRNLKVLVILIALLTGAGLADEHNGVLSPGKYGRVNFSVPVQFGQRLLPAGTYEFHCFHKEKYHLMAVYRVFRDPDRGTVTLWKPFAIDYCRMEGVREKVKVTSAVTTRDPAGNAVLNEVRIQGEQVRHIFGEVLGVDPADDQ